jgi:hypothetical protein
MQIEAIEIHAGAVDFEYTPVRELEAKCEATTAFQRAPTIDDASAKLRQMAASVGANAVINVQYKSGVSMTSWKSMKAIRLAVRRETDDTDYMPCPVCAERIKRAAIKCCFWGRPVHQVGFGGRLAASTAGAQPPRRTSARSASVDE